MMLINRLIISNKFYATNASTIYNMLRVIYSDNLYTVFKKKNMLYEPPTLAQSNLTLNEDF